MGIQDKYPHKTDTVLNDWTAIAQNTVVASVVMDMSEKSKYIMNIHAALDSTTAHTGTRFIVQTSSVKEGDEDWYPIADFVAMIGTAATDLIEDNPLAAGSTDIALTGHALTVEGKLLFIEDATLANSEVVLEASQTANEVVILDGTENAHALNTAVFNIVMSQSVALPSAAMRARLVVDNTYDDNGSTLNCRVNVNAARNE
jgi:hypothetical protein